MINRQLIKYNLVIHFTAIIILFLVFNTKITANNGQYKIEGVTPLLVEGSIAYLESLDSKTGKLNKIDSSFIKNGKFEFIDKIDGLNLRIIKTDSSKVPIIAEEGIVFFKDDSKITIGGTPKNDSLQIFLERQASFSPSELENKKKDYYSFCLANSENELGEYLILNSTAILSPEEIFSLIVKTRDNFQNNSFSQVFFKFLGNSLNDKPGRKFTDMTLSGIDGQEDSLSNYIGKGKTVFLLFWASWCPDCERIMKDLVDISQEYRGDSFEIVAISLDYDNEAWIKAISDFKMDWIHLSDLKGRDSEVATIYNLKGIPSGLFIDKNGIITDNLKGDQTISQLKKLLKAKTN